jgi:hypothetical protein
LAASAVAQDEAVQRALQQLRERVDELEEQQAKTEERIGSRALAQAYSARSLDVGGHVTSLFTSMHGESGTTTGHVVSFLELFLRAQLSDEWSLFATPGFYVFHGGLLDDPTTTTAGDPALVEQSNAEAETTLSRLYGQWKASDLLVVEAGIVGSPHGTTNRQYFIPARVIGEATLHTRVFQANQLYPQQVDGVRVSGKTQVGTGSDLIDYDAYFGTEDNSPSDGIGGARLAYLFDDLGLSIAANYGRGTREAVSASSVPTNVPILQTPYPPRFIGGRDYEFVGVDVEWRFADLVNKTEVYLSAEGAYADQRAVSTEWSWFASQNLTLSYRFDYYEPGVDERIVSLAPFATAPMDLGHTTEHVVGICYDPNPSVRLRLDLHHMLLPNSDDTIDFANVSWSLSF